MTTPPILVERRDGADGAPSIAWLTLARPDVLNSFDRPMAAALRAALDACATDDAVRAVVLTGAGRAFCAGQDLAAVLPQPGAPEPDLGDVVRDCYNPIVRALRALEKPVIAAVNGVAAGAGANLAFACDFVVAAESASFIQSFCHVGLIPDSAGTWMLPRLVGLARATELAMLGEKVPAEKAHAWGMIHRVVPAAEVAEQALALARRLAAMPTRGLGLTKRGFEEGAASTLDAQLDREEALQRAAGRTADYAEGVRAFVEKRKPSFTGR